MIFVTVGTDMPFDRMIKTVDAWAQENNRSDIFAQIGEGGWKPKHIGFKEFLEPPEFKERFAAADVIVAHAGMGTILSALNAGKSIVIMPRIAKFGEQRNEHQLATSKRMKELGLISVAADENELVKALGNLNYSKFQAQIGLYADEKLVDKIKKFIVAVR